MAVVDLCSLRRDDIIRRKFGIHPRRVHLSRGLRRKPAGHLFEKATTLPHYLELRT